MFWTIILAMAIGWLLLPDDHSSWSILDEGDKNENIKSS